MDHSCADHRRNPRCHDKNFLDFEILSPQGVVVGRGLARTLNVSENGLLLETGQAFAVGQTLRITLGLRDELVQITGSVAHSEPNAAALFHAGVCFLSVPEEDRATYRQHLETLRRLIAD
jgi:hypothetical protein